MIYQCYFRKDQEKFIFNTDVYSPFGLEPNLNPNITNNCPELEDESTRFSLTEYAAFLNIYKNDVFKFDSDWWIGFTSYRQLDKTPIIFKNKSKFEELLMLNNGFAGWGFYYSKSNASTMSEILHPKINDFIKEVFKKFNLKIPNRFYKDNYILFANYWAMKKEYFIDFMDWSWPLVQYGMTLNDHEYTKMPATLKTIDSKKWIGYFMERLFIIWYMTRNYNPANFGPVCGVVV